MASKLVRYYVGRLNLISASSAKLDLQRRALASSTVLEVRKQRWGFYEFKELGEGPDIFFTGFLVKYKAAVDEEIVVPERHTLEDTSIENRVTAKSRFFLHGPSGLIAFHPVSNQISRQLFAGRFAEVFEHSMGNFFVNAEIQSIQEQVTLLDELRYFRTVNRVSISLHPSNPSNRDIWRRVDERLRGVNATSYRESYEADARKGGLRVTEDPDITQKIAMAQDGYGKVEVIGERDGKLVKFSTRDNPMSILAPSDVEGPNRIFPAIRESVSSFLDRFRQ